MRFILKCLSWFWNGRWPNDSDTVTGPDATYLSLKQALQEMKPVEPVDDGFKAVSDDFKQDTKIYSNRTATPIFRHRKDLAKARSGQQSKPKKAKNVSRETSKRRKRSK